MSSSEQKFCNIGQDNLLIFTQEATTDFFRNFGRENFQYIKFLIKFDDFLVVKQIIKITF